MEEELEKKNKELQERIAEIKGMSNKQVVWALCHEAVWYVDARRDMRTELADNTYKDMELLKLEILGRMIEPNRETLTDMAISLGNHEMFFPEQRGIRGKGKMKGIKKV